MSKWYYCKNNASELRKKRFASSTKDTFYNGTLEHPIGKGFSIMVRTNGEVLLGLNGLFMHEHELIDKFVDVFKLDYDIIEGEDWRECEEKGQEWYDRVRANAETDTTAKARDKSVK